MIVHMAYLLTEIIVDNDDGYDVKAVAFLSVLVFYDANIEK